MRNLHFNFYKKIFLFFFILSCSVSSIISQTLSKNFPDGIIYVSSTGTGSGTSWSDATSNLQAAVNAASVASSSPSVWVKAGTYVGNPDSLNAFVMVEGVNVYGGFSGNETTLSGRDLKANKSILSGQGRQRVLMQAGEFTDSTAAMWDGFVMEKGKASRESDNSGAGAWLKAYGRLINCEIRENTCVEAGSTAGIGVYMKGNGSALINCLIHDNYQSVAEGETYYHEIEGGGVYAAGGNSIINCTVANNRTCGSGSGIHLRSAYGLPSRMINTIIWGNRYLSSYGELTEDNYNLEIYSYTNDYPATVSFSAIEGGWSGEGNINVSGSDLQLNEDFSLGDGSVCINAGMTVAGASEIDIYSNKRTQGESIDMGAVESSSTFSIKPDTKNIIYVSSTGTATGDGSSWAKATNKLQAAVNVAARNKSSVWVTSGTYMGDTTALNAFVMVEGVNVYGGFSGNETTLSERDLKANKSILSGQGRQRVLMQAGEFTDSTAATWDGFVIEKGKASRESNNSGAGAWLKAYGSLINCEIRENTCVEAGSTAGIGVYMKGNGSALINCLIHDNYQSVAEGETYYHEIEGGGVYAAGGNSIINCTVANNRTCGSGSGIHLRSAYGLPSRMINTIIWGNRYLSSYGELTEDNYNLEIYSYSDDYPATVSFSAIEGTESDGDGNLSLESQNNGLDKTLNYIRFINPKKANYYLHATSACIDKAVDSVNTLSVDLDGNARIYNKKTDMGAYEYDGKYVSMQTYEQRVCSGTETVLVDFDKIADSFTWTLNSASKVSGFQENGLDTIPTMTLSTSAAIEDTLIYDVVPSLAGENLEPFQYKFVVVPIVPIAEFTNITPKDSIEIDEYEVSLNWNNPKEATEVELYFWNVNDTTEHEPITTFKNSSYGYYTYRNLINKNDYKWKLSAKNECAIRESQEMNIQVRIPSSLVIQEDSIYPIGSKYKETASVMIDVRGIELSDTIVFSLSGADKSYFQITPDSLNWNVVKGGRLKLSFTPSEQRNDYNALLTVKSGNYADTMLLSGFIANYYEYMVNVEKEVYGIQDTVVINGKVIDAFDRIVSNKEMDLYLLVMGYRRAFRITTNDNGEFVYHFKSQYAESGHYSVGVCLPGEESVKEFDSFDILGMEVTESGVRWTTYLGTTLNGYLLIKNKSEVALTGISVESVETAPGCSVNFQPVDTLPGGGFARLHYDVTGSELTEGNDYLPCKFTLSSKEGIKTELLVYYYCAPAYGMLSTNPLSINTTMTKGEMKNVKVLLFNKGNSSTGKISVELPNIDWMSSVYGETLNAIAVGDSAKLLLRLAPEDDIQLNTPFTGNIVLKCENGTATSLPFTIEATSESVGSMQVEVVDEYYYTSEEKPHLTGAIVTLVHPFTKDTIVSGITDETGILNFPDVKEGNYLLTVKAEKHAEYQEYVTIDAGRQLDKFILVNYQAVTYSWEVVRTEVEDKYKIDLVVTFETNVPVPTVTMELSRDLPKLEDIQDGEIVNFYLVLSNHGLIAAKDVEINFPALEGYEMIPLMNHIDSLPARYTQVVPVTLKKSNNSNRSGGKGNCVSISSTYVYACGGKDHSGSATTKQLWDHDCSGGTSGGGYGFGGFGGFGGSAGFSTAVTTSLSYDNCKDTTDCKKLRNDALKDCVLEIIGTATGLGNYISAVTCGAGIGNAVNSGSGMGSALGGCVTGFIPLYGCLTNTAKYLLCEMQQPGNGTRAGSSLLTDEKLLDRAIIDMYTINRIFEFRRLIAIQTFGDAELVSKSGFGTFVSSVFSSLNSDTPIKSEVVRNIPVSDISANEMLAMANYWNNSLDAWSNGDNSPKEYGNKDSVIAYTDSIKACFDYVASRGFDNDLEAMYEEASEILQYEINKEQTGVCARVKLLISQTLTMTREAFEGTLTITNGNDTTLEAVNMQIEILDEDGNLANDLFQFNTLSLKELTGVDGNGTLASGATGNAVFQFIPTKNAALVSPKVYSFGGKFSYVDPATGDTVRNTLYPVLLTVNPSPDLYIDYFMQRDILGDDAMTEDRIEPVIPAALGVLINNRGTGDARNVTLSTAQPKIIDNEKGLLIDFSIIGSSLNGLNCQLGSQMIDFGTISSRSSSVGVWWLTSSLMGHFVEYEASVVHENSYRNPNLSLISSVRIHELIHVVNQYGESVDSVPDFLVNDVADVNHYPDSLFFSDGTTTGVYIADEAWTDQAPTDQDTVITLTVDPSRSGWNYIRIDDPGANKFEIDKIVRVSDLQEIPTSNVWLTHVTMVSGADPKYENKLHFLDTFSVDASESYLLTYRLSRTTLEVTDIDTIPESYIEDPLTNVIVTFNEPIQDSTFTYKDMSLKCQAGSELMDSTVTVTKLSDTQFKVDISSKTQGTGYYVLTVQTLNINNYRGYGGYYGKSASWVQVINGLVVTTDTISIISSDKAILRGNVDSLEQSAKIIEKGFKWKLVSEDSYNTLSATDSFTCELSGLNEEDKYEYIAFIITENDTIYGTPVIFTTDPRGIGVESVLSSIVYTEVYPNPAADYLFLQINGYSESKNFIVSLVNTNGKIIKTQKIEDFLTCISLKGIKSGLYLLKITENNDLQNVLKIIKK